MFFQSYEFGRIVDASAAGSAPNDLTTSYTPGTVLASKGIGNVSLRCSVVLGSADSVSLRLMDYSDAANPRALAVAVPGGSLSAEYVASASGDFDLVCPLGGVVPAICVEKKGVGTLTGASVTVDCTASEKF